MTDHYPLDDNFAYHAAQAHDIPVLAMSPRFDYVERIDAAVGQQRSCTVDRPIRVAEHLALVMHRHAIRADMLDKYLMRALHWTSSSVDFYSAYADQPTAHCRAHSRGRCRCGRCYARATACARCRRETPRSYASTRRTR